MDDDDKNSIVNLFHDWIDASTPHQLFQALIWLNQHAKLRRYPGSTEDMQRIQQIIRNTIEE